METSSGVILLGCTILALFLANSELAHQYESFWKIPISISFGASTLTHSLGHWINDGLMTIFFFLIGLEIKRELISGELKDPRAAMLPAMAALGGMLLPALIYWLKIGSNEGAHGWGIPMATDIAFVVGFLSLLGKRVPHGLKIFILSLAIVDDIGAVIVIAVFYTSTISWAALGIGFAGLALTSLLNLAGVRRIPVYVVVGAGIWLCFLLSGVHPTVAGVLLGLLTPASAWIGDKTLLEVLSEFGNKLGPKSASNDKKSTHVGQLIRVARETVSPLERLELGLHPWVAFFIMPLFALANAGVALELEAVKSPISLAVISGLFLGKPIGIFLFTFLAVKFFGGKLPQGVSWRVILGAGFLSGIGFTMSIFVAGLAFENELLVDGKIGTLAGSCISAIVGILMLHMFLPKRKGQS